MAAILAWQQAYSLQGHMYRLKQRREKLKFYKWTPLTRLGLESIFYKVISGLCAFWNRSASVQSLCICLHFPSPPPFVFSHPFFPFSSLPVCSLFSLERQFPWIFPTQDWVRAGEKELQHCTAEFSGQMERPKVQKVLTIVYLLKLWKILVWMGEISSDDNYDPGRVTVSNPCSPEIFYDLASNTAPETSPRPCIFHPFGNPDPIIHSLRLILLLKLCSSYFWVFSLLHIHIGGQYSYQFIFSIYAIPLYFLSWVYTLAHFTG